MPAKRKARTSASSSRVKTSGIKSSQSRSVAKNGALLYQTAIIDIHERKRGEQQLDEQARLLDLSTDAIIVRDVKDRVTYWNKGATKTYGYTREEALGK